MLKGFGKLSIIENKCPHCGTSAKHKIEDKQVMELSAQYYKVCNKCHGRFVDTYLIDWGNEEDEGVWRDESLWLTKNQARRFNQLKKSGNLTYDKDNPNEASDYYEYPLQSIDFIKDGKNND